MTPKKWGIAAVSIIAIGIIAYLVSNFSPKTKRVYTGFKGEARINSLLAAGELFEHTGHRVQSFSTFSMANLREDYVSAIICPISALPKTKVEIEFLEEWLELGGHLITGIRQKGHINSDTFPEELKRFLKVKEIIPDAYEETIQASIQNLSADLQFETELEPTHSVIPDLKSSKANNLIIKDKGITLFYETYVGEGLISFFTDFGIFENKKIDEGKNASLLYKLVVGPDDYEDVNIYCYYGQNVESLYSWLWKNAMSGILGLTLLVIMYITNRSRRFGPILVKNLTCRRQLMEHIKATAHFYHRLDNGHSLYAELRQTVLDNLSKSFPHIQHQALGRELSKLTGMNEKEVSNALTAPVKELNLAEATQTLQNLRRYL